MRAYLDPVQLEAPLLKLIALAKARHDEVTAVQIVSGYSVADGGKHIWRIDCVGADGNKYGVSFD